MFITTVEFNGLSSTTYRNRILQSQLKILAKIQLSVICVHMQAWSHVILLHLWPYCCIGLVESPHQRRFMLYRDIFKIHFSLVGKSLTFVSMYLLHLIGRWRRTCKNWLPQSCDCLFDVMWSSDIGWDSAGSVPYSTPLTCQRLTTCLFISPTWPYRNTGYIYH